MDATFAARLLIILDHSIADALDVPVANFRAGVHMRHQAGHSSKGLRTLLHRYGHSQHMIRKPSGFCGFRCLIA